MNYPRPIVLIILDGWGLSQDHRNILTTTKLPTIKKLNQYYPLIGLQASSISVGLPWGEAGNSEVGHISLGAGRIIYQSLPRISLAIKDYSFFTNPALLSAAKEVKKNKSTLHIMGLLSSGAVHSHYDHLLALLELAQRQRIDNVMIHPFMDGRDSAPTSGIDMIARLQNDIKDIGIGRIASVIGRHWAMDRNNNWERTQKAYDMLCGDSKEITNVEEYMSSSYESGTTDEFIDGAVVTEDGKAVGTIQDGDAIIFFNFREDRARQITKAFVVDDFTEFNRGKKKDIVFSAMMEYEKGLPMNVAFPSQIIDKTLGEILSDYKKTQLRIGETEKYAHVTYFFNGGAEKPFAGEDRKLIPSPYVSRFDEAPEMSSAIVTQSIIDAVTSDKYDFILANYANADMVGHTGNIEACRVAVQSIDKSLSLLIPPILKAGGEIFITADHGNVEELYNSSNGMVSTEHSTNPVPLWHITPNNHLSKPRDASTIPRVSGLLSDVAPTILARMGLDTPREMDGQDLIDVLNQTR